MSRRAEWALVMGMWCFAPALWGQVSAETGSARIDNAGAPSFEVATIKPVDPTTGGAIGFYGRPGGRVLVGFADLKMLIYYAYEIPRSQILGGEPWMEKERYNIEAVPPEGSPSRTAQGPPIQATPSQEQREMLRTLLAQRFALKIHRETKEGQVYILSRGKGELHLHKPEHEDADTRMSSMMKPGNIADGEATGINVSMPFMAKKLSDMLRRPVLDQTGLTGKYDFHLEPDDPTNTDYTAGILDVMKRLGLNLKSGKGPVETVVIDSASKPTEN